MVIESGAGEGKRFGDDAMDGARRALEKRVASTRILTGPGKARCSILKADILLSLILVYKLCLLIELVVFKE